MKKIILAIMILAGTSTSLGASKLKAYKKSCDDGNGTSCFNLGTMYLDGLGAIRDKLKAKEFFKKGCESSETVGCKEFASIEFASIIVPRKPKKIKATSNTLSLTLDDIRTKITECSSKNSDTDKIECYNALAGTLATKTSRVETFSISGTAFEKDAYSGEIKVVCQGDPIIFAQRGTWAQAQLDKVMLDIANASLAHAYAESSRLHGDIAKYNELMSSYREANNLANDRIKHLLADEETHHAKCDLSGNYSIDGLPKGYYTIAAIIKNKKTSGHIVISVPDKSITKNEKIILVD